ncbi:ADP-ribosylglycohydrolase family protein [Pelomyxa schiedti]|nr:ADP-ribosylglycohydrolase family protein [Pelomyxa schiedti]
MGNSQSQGTKTPMTAEEAAVAFRFPEGVDIDRDDTWTSSALSGFSILRPDDPDRAAVQKRLLNNEWTGEENASRAVASMLGMMIGDALGAPLEFSRVRYNVIELRGFEDRHIWQGTRFGLSPGQWTDDASMGLCLADSLLCCRGFNPQDLRLRFQNWWSFGYNNAFSKVVRTRDNQQLIGRGSVGLGGNISSSFTEFLKSKTEYTTAGDRETSGNGSLMRNAPVALYYCHELAKLLDFSYKQSKTTHQGDEAADCCRVLSYIIGRAVTTPATKEEALSGIDMAHFAPPLCYSVQCLANSVAEEANPSNQKLKLEDRNWNWKDPNFRWSANRAREDPGYIGSYAMDALSMALHCVWTTPDFPSALIKAANTCGDSDTVCDITGQIAGAIYGAGQIPKTWIEAVQQWEPTPGDSALKAWKLYHHGEL